MHALRASYVPVRANFVFFRHVGGSSIITMLYQAFSLFFLPLHTAVLREIKVAHSFYWPVFF